MPNISLISSFLYSLVIKAGRDLHLAPDNCKIGTFLVISNLVENGKNRNMPADPEPRPYSQLS